MTSVINGATVEVSSLGGIENGLTNDGGTLDDLNLGAQEAAMIASIQATVIINPGTAATAILADETAMATGAAVLVADAQNFKNGTGSLTPVAADVATLFGDLANAVSAYGNITENKPLALGATFVGNALTIIGIEIQTPQIANQIIDNAETVADGYIDTLANNVGTAIASAASSAIQSVEQDILNSLNSFSAVLSDASSNSANLSADVQTAQNNLGISNNDIANAVQAAGGTASDLTLTVTPQTGTNGTLTGEDVTGSDGSAGTLSYLSSGGTEVDQNPAAGGSQGISFDPSSDITTTNIY